MGTRGERRGNMNDNGISIYDFLTKHKTIIRFDQPVGGHGGGDQGIVRSFLRDIDEQGENESRSSASVSLRSHLMAFAAEESRLNKGKSIELDRYYDDIMETST